MSFISILSKIGKGFLGAAPFVTTALSGTGLPALTQIATLVGTAEAVGEIVKQHGGKVDKLQAILPEVKTVVASIDILKGKSVADPDLFEAGCVDITNGVVKVLKAFQA
jgi:hypothetical protein